MYEVPSQNHALWERLRAAPCPATASPLLQCNDRQEEGGNGAATKPAAQRQRETKLIKLAVLTLPN